MKVIVQSKSTKNIFKTPILQQTAFWSEVKRKQGIIPKAFNLKIEASDIYTDSEDQKNIIDDMLVLLEHVGDDFKIAYIPYGPKIKPSNDNKGLFLEKLSESLRPYLPTKCILLRYDLLWKSLWAEDDSYFDDNDNWTGPPRKANQEIRLNFDTQKWNLKKSNTNILPQDTIFVDLTKGESTLLKEMKSKTRYNIRLSGRKGISVRRTDLKELDVWYTLYKQTCKRNKMYLHKKKYFKSVLNTNATNTSSPAEVELLIAEHNQTPLAAMFLVFSGQRATYLYGASSAVKKNFMATYALQWEAMKRAKKRGCTEYDMFGVAPSPDPSHPLYGLYKFKSGFGGNLFHRMGCWDYPLNNSIYKMYLTAEMHSKGFHLY